MIKILYVCCNFTYGGVEQYILNVIDCIDREKFYIDVLLPERTHEYEREADLRARNIKVIKYSCKSIKEKLKTFKDVLIKNNYNVIHFHTGHESALLALIARFSGNKNIVVHAHTSQSGDENRKWLHLLKKRIIFLFSEIIYSRLTNCVSCSTDAAQFMFGKYNKNVKIMDNGIDLKRFRKKKSGVSEYSLCINARFDVQKNPLFVVEVIKELVKREPSVTLEWIGSGLLKKEVENKISEYHLEENIRLIGTCNDVENVLGRNRFFLLPSLYEGLGIVLVEAQAMGMKCFISDAIPERANLGGGYTIPLEYDARQWAEIMLNEMSKGVETKIDQDKLKLFDIKNTTKTLEEFYCSILCEKMKD